MWNEMNMQQLINQFLPSGAKLLRLDEPNKRIAVVTADLDGDNTHEIAAAYHFNGNNRIVVLKWFRGYWYPISYLTGKGYGITSLNAAPIKGEKKSELIIGWQFGSALSQLDIEEWTGNSFQPLITDEIYFSEIEVANLPTLEGLDKKYEIALWVHDTGEAYSIEVYQWDGEMLASYPEAYPFYFDKVAKYYQKKVAELPDAAFYWYYLADAQAKAEQYGKALKSIETAISLGSDYPPKQKLWELKEYIMTKLKGDVYLYPAPLETAEGVKWGYISDDGIFRIQPQYEYAMDFLESDRAIVSIMNAQGFILYGVIDKQGNFIIEPICRDMKVIGENRIAVCKAPDDEQLSADSEYAIADIASGSILTDFIYTNVLHYDKGCVSVSDGTNTYFLDENGRMDELLPIAEGVGTLYFIGNLIKVNIENKISYMDIGGNVIWQQDIPVPPDT